MGNLILQTRPREVVPPDWIDIQSMPSLFIKVKNILKYRYWIHMKNYQFLWNSESIVLGVENNIIRITSSKHRLEKEIHAELCLLDILYTNGCSVIPARYSVNKKLFETVHIGGEVYYITIFKTAEWRKVPDWVLQVWKTFYKKWGASIGKIHKNIAQCTDPNIADRSPWYENISIQLAKDLLPPEDTHILLELYEVMKALWTLDKRANTYWLTHSDMRRKNFHYNNGNLIHFDFDDLAHNWFVYDIAVSAFHETEEIDSAETRTRFICRLLTDMINGYLTENSIPDEILQCIVLFLKLRCIYVYIEYFRRLKLKGIDSGKERMLTRRVFILNFEKFISSQTLREAINNINK